MNTQEIRFAAEAICEMRNPLRIKAEKSKHRYGGEAYTRRSDIALKEAELADAKELREVCE